MLFELWRWDFPVQARGTKTDFTDRGLGCTMGFDIIDLENMIDDLQASEREQSNCMFQLSLMMARLALSPVSEAFKDETAQALLALVRAKRKSNPVVVTHKFVPENRKPWLTEVQSALPQVQPMMPVSAKFGSGGLS